MLFDGHDIGEIYVLRQNFEALLTKEVLMAIESLILALLNFYHILC